MTLLRATDLVVDLGGRRVLDHVSFSIDGGEMVGLIGPNGAGKTTLLRALAGLSQPFGGEILFRDRTLASLAEGERARAIAYLAQDGECHWPLAAYSVVALGRLPHGTSGTDIRSMAAIDRALAETDSAAFRDRPVTTLSGGERARVLLARALAVEAPVLLADEPVAGLDPAHALDVMAALRRRASAGTAIVVVVHDLTVAARFCDRLVLLHGGAVRAEGPASEVLSADHLARFYGVRAHIAEADGAPVVVPVAHLDEGYRP